MSEKNEKWIIFALIALALWWLFKKYGTGQGQTAVVSNTIGGVPGDTATTFYPNGGSLANPRTESGLPASTTVKSFPAAQPSVLSYIFPGPARQWTPSQTSTPPRIAPASQMVSAGVQYSGGNVSSPILRSDPASAYSSIGRVAALRQ